jgi:hypothetical protein
VTGTIKKNIQTTTIYIFCVVWVLTVPKYIDIRLNSICTTIYEQPVAQNQTAHASVLWR